MKGIILLFFVLSLGTLTTISAGGISYSLRYIELGLILCFLLLCAKSYNKGLEIKITNWDSIYYALWVLCFMYSILTYFWSSDPPAALSGSLVLFFGLLAIVVANYYLNKNPNIFVVANRLFVVSLFIQLAVSMSQVLGSYGLSFYVMKSNASTLIGDSNAISFFFTFSLLFEFISKEKRWLLYTLINAFGVILTISRGAIFSLAICIAVYVFILVFNKRLKKMRAIISLGMLCILFFVFIRYTIPGMELWNGLNSGLQASSVGTRQIMWGETIQQITQNPFGNGVVWENDPHNIVLRSIRDFGIGFGLVFLFLIGYPLFYFLRISTLRLSNKSIAILIAYLSIFVHALIEIFYLSTTTITYTVFVLTFLNIVIRNDDKERLNLRSNAA